MKSKNAKILAWGSVALLVIILLGAGMRLLVGGNSRKGGTEYYDTAVLTNKSIPAWNATNSIPLSPDKAVIAAVKYANSKRVQPILWDIDSVELRRYSQDSSWFYTITLTDRKSGLYALEVVSVLMNGEVWKPTSSKN